MTAAAPSDEAAIAVVVVTHQTRDEALGCLASLGPDDADEVVVVDTGSTDGSADAVRASHPEVRVLELANAGFGRGANAGVRATTTPHVLVVNADVRVTPGSVRRLAEELTADPRLGAVGPEVRYPDGSRQASARQVPDLATAVGHALLGRVAPDNRWTRRYRQTHTDPVEPRDVEWLSGCALALRRRAFDDVDGFDPGYHLYVEDLDLGVRLRAAGWALRYQPAARVVHRVGASTAGQRGRALASHAASVDRYLRRHHRSMLARLLRPVVRVALVGWVAATWSWERVLGGRRSTTGERRDAAGERRDATGEGRRP